LVILAPLGLKFKCIWHLPAKTRLVGHLGKYRRRTLCPRGARGRKREPQQQKKKVEVINIKAKKIKKVYS